MSVRQSLRRTGGIRKVCATKLPKAGGDSGVAHAQRKGNLARTWGLAREFGLLEPLGDHAYDGEAFVRGGLRKPAQNIDRGYTAREKPGETVIVDGHHQELFVERAWLAHRGAMRIGSGIPDAAREVGARCFGQNALATHGLHESYEHCVNKIVDVVMSGRCSARVTPQLHLDGTERAPVKIIGVTHGEHEQCCGIIKVGLPGHCAGNRARLAMMTHLLLGMPCTRACSVTAARGASHDATS